jgi:ATP-binding cassette subfamily B protein
MESTRSAAHRYGKLASYARRRWPALSVIALLTLFVALTTALQPWPLKILVDYALADAGLPEAFEGVFKGLSDAQAALRLIVLAAAVSLALFVIGSALDAALSLIWSSAGQRMVYEFATDLYERFCALNLSFHSRQPVGDSLSRLSIDTYSIFAVVQSLLAKPTQQILTLCIVASFAWTMDPQLTLIAFMVAPLIAVISWLVGARMKQRSRAQREAQSNVMTLVQRTLVAMPIVQAFGAEARNRLEFENLSSEAVMRAQRSVLLNKSFGSLNGLLMTIGTAVVIFVGSQRVLSGALTVGSLLVFVAYLQTIRSALGGLLSVYGSIKVTEASVDRVLEILDSEEVVADRPGADPLRRLPNGGVGDVCFERVTVGYRPGRAVLQDVTLEAKAGETVALVGRTGSGKSTLVSLLPRFLDPWQGRVTIGGQDLRDVSLSSLRAQIGLVLQESFLLPISVAANIAYGRPEASRAEIEAAARAANADEFIRRLPEGYDTVLGERGATLSGGQSQRLSIARALLKDAPILVLDEPTSALDAETEASFLSALERLMSGRTTFIIAHRLSTIRHADRIFVLENGRIVESGSHGELMSAGGPYQRMHGLQFSETTAGEVT